MWSFADDLCGHGEISGHLSGGRSQHDQGLIVLAMLFVQRGNVNRQDIGPIEQGRTLGAAAYDARLRLQTVQQRLVDRQRGTIVVGVLQRAGEQEIRLGR